MNRAINRTNTPRPGYAPAQPRQMAQPAPQAAVSDIPPHPDKIGTGLCIAGLVLTGIFLSGSRPEDVARFGAYGTLLSICLSLIVDLRQGIRNVVRTDVMALMSLYFLTLAEFLVKQGQYNAVASMEATRTAVLACMCAIGGMMIGRHLIKPTTKHPFSELFRQSVPNSVLLSIFWFCVLIGYLNMLVSVKFDVFLMVDYFMAPRFVQPWQRGRLGDWAAMLYELDMLLYLVPPLGGILLARRHKFSALNIGLVMAGVGFTLFYAFSSGTRNIFASYLVTFLIGYVFAAGPRQKKEVLIMTVCSGLAMVAATKIMLDFREVGLKQYIVQGLYYNPSNTQAGQALAVDNNLYAISRVAEFFPRHHNYTNIEIPYLALIHPIPRVLWPGKPEGMSISVEDIFGAGDWTVATSVVGEEWMMHGYIGVLVMSLFFGACCGWWNLLASTKNSEFGILVYASGFFSAVITMRSMNWCSTALLPTGAGLVLGFVLLRMHRKKPSKAQPLPPRRGIAPAPR